jgi:hypothetical protein
MSDPKWSQLAEEIRLTIAKISQVEAKIETQRKEMERAGLFSYVLDDRIREQNRMKYEYLEDLQNERDVERQKLIGLQLGSINTYSEQLSQSMQTLNQSMQILNDSTKKLVKSSKKLEYLSILLVIVAIVNISVILIPFNPFYALVDILAGAFAMIQLWRRARRELATTTTDSN